MKTGIKPETFPPEQQKRPGMKSEMELKPEYIRPNYKGCGKLDGKVDLISEGDSVIGRSIAIHSARDGAYVAISFLNVEDKDANITKDLF